MVEGAAAAGERRRCHSQARVVGTLDPPRGWSFHDVLTNPAAERDCLLDFHVRAARILAVPAGRLYITRKPAATDVEKAKRGPGRWHRDRFGGPGPLLTLIGDTPTEFLLGDYDEGDLDDPARHPRLEATLRPWQPAAAELVLIDGDTVHRRPRLVTGLRLYLLATVDTSVFTAMRKGLGEAAP